MYNTRQIWGIKQSTQNQITTNPAPTLTVSAGQLATGGTFLRSREVLQKKQ